MSDPYRILGVSRTATDAEIRAAYRKLVKATHPDHNGGSPEAARRFEAVQQAYAEIQERRRGSAQTEPGRPRPDPGRPRPDPGRPQPDPDLESRMADLERQVREARARAQRAAREAMRRGKPERPSDEELGYVTTDDSFTKILADARTELSERYANAREHPVVQRVSDLIAGLEELASKLDRPPRGK